MFFLKKFVFFQNEFVLSPMRARTLWWAEPNNKRCLHDVCVFLKFVLFFLKRICACTLRTGGRSRIINDVYMMFVFFFKICFVFSKRICALRCELVGGAG